VRPAPTPGTHYCDLTGEVLFMRRSIDAAHAAAAASGARIVHTCGFDSIPSDLGVFLLAEHAREHGLGELEDTTLVVKAIAGGVSGGTVDSLRGQLDEARADKKAMKLMLDPYGLSPDRAAEPDLGSERDPVGVIRDPELGGYLAPFVMGTVNTRVVRRTNALLGHAHGRRLRYRELMLGGGLPLGPAKAAGIAAGLGVLLAGLAVPPTRKLLDRVLPDPGQGPSEAARDKGFFRLDVHTRTTTGARLVCAIQAPGDPGYKATAVMLGGERARARPRRGPPARRGRRADARDRDGGTCWPSACGRPATATRCARPEPELRWGRAGRGSPAAAASSRRRTASW
jgi:short subunit dehydrogenase-like uncharacterized protein